jgi:hypothetical protein
VHLILICVKFHIKLNFNTCLSEDKFMKRFMKPISGLTFGFLLIMLTLVLLTTGCTQPSTAPVGSTTPTPITTSQVTTPATSALPATTTAQTDNQTLKKEMMALAETLANNIDRQNLSAALTKGENSTAFTAVLGQLQAFKEEHPQVTYDYLLEQKNGTVTLVVTNYYGEPGAPGFMETYNNPPAELKTPITKPIRIGPYTDEYGTFVSGFAPVDLELNATVILVGVDARV